MSLEGGPPPPVCPSHCEPNEHSELFARSLRFETDSGWASALELKPLLLLGAHQPRGLHSGAASASGESSAGAAADRTKDATRATKESCPRVAAVEQQRRLKELEQLGIRTVENRCFFFCRVPKKAGNHVLSLVETGRAAEWRR